MAASEPKHSCHFGRWSESFVADFAEGNLRNACETLAHGWGFCKAKNKMIDLLFAKDEFSPVPKGYKPGDLKACSRNMVGRCKLIPR